jgi:DNA-binding response OmpR family regulator
VSKPTILLVEDDDFAAMVAAEMLAADYDVRHVDNGQAALDFMAEGAPDLVLLDVEMPGMSGYDVCRTPPPCVTFMAIRTTPDDETRHTGAGRCPDRRPTGFWPTPQ